MENHAPKQQVIYQADANTVHTLKNIRDRAYQASRPYIQRPVRIQTIEGTTYEGTLVNLDGTHLYLSIPQPNDSSRALGYPRSYYNNVILPLVLYELLVITLLYT